MTAPGAWRGRRVLITAGPTREPLDPVRYLTNASSGAMGLALADAALALGARVRVVCGPIGNRTRPRGVSFVRVTTAEEMRREVLAARGGVDVFVGAAAVGDWRFGRVAASKIKRTDRTLSLTLVPNPDIIAEVARRRRGAGGSRPKVVVGFALETDRPVERASEKLRRKGLDLIVANGPEALASDRSRFAVIDRLGRVRRYARMTKRRAARVILSHAERLL